MSNPSMTRTPPPLPQSFTLLIGPPRSGTTLIANTFMSHSTVAGVIEPYQRRRHEGYATTDLEDFIAENRHASLSERPNLAVKETTTRKENVDLSLALMKSAADRGIHTGLVLILRCPFAAYLSQVEAARTMWAQKKLTEVSRDTFLRWSRTQRKALKALTDHARAQHFRIVSYEAFCADPVSETARLMALVPERLEPDNQLDFAPPKSVVAGGDPKTREKSGRIALTDRSDRIEALIRTVGPSEELNLMQALRRVVLTNVCREPDHVTLDRLSRLLA